MDDKFESVLSAIKQPLLGLEFLIYLDDGCDGLDESNFYCAICSKFGNIKNMIQHIKSSSHVLKYLKTMLPEVVEAFNFPLFMNSRGSVESGGFFEMLAGEVEIEFGRGNPRAYENVSLKNKWKACFIHLNKILCSRNKPERRVVEKLIKRVQRKRAELKSRKRKQCQEKSQHLIRERSSKPCTIRQHLKRFSSNENRPRLRTNVSKRSPLKNRTENLQRKRHRERSPSEDRHVQPCAFNELPVSIIDQYRWEYDRNLEEICIRYKKYGKTPESHPKYIETWNFYWLEEFYKLNQIDRQASKTDFTPKWRGYWKKRSVELRDEEELEMRIKLRERLEIAISPEDKQKLKWIQDRDKVMIKEKSPFVPILITNEITNTIRPETVKIEEIDKVSEHIKQLTDSDLVILFSNIDELSEELREGLLDHMSSMETNEPERYQNLLSICLDEENLTQKHSIESETKNEFESIDSDDSYTLDDVVMTVQDKFDLCQN